jgi:hypothetical protein
MYGDLALASILTTRNSVMMDQELKKKWIAGMESGEYKHCTGYLKSGDCHCALGVLADVAGLKIAESGCGIIVDGVDKGYTPFYALFGGKVGPDFDHGTDLICEVYDASDRRMDYLDALKVVKERA